MSADYIFNKPLSAKQKAVLRKLKRKQDAGDDSGIDFSDIPELTEEQLANARRPARKLVAARLDPDVMEWLQSFGPGYSTRINALLRSVMEHQKR
ncbi:MAG TPA: BrnA antitoxin family protein [Bryobacteraceae bacterium]